MPSIANLLTLTPAEVAKLSRRELAQVVSQLASAANKRLRRLEQTPMGTESRPYKQVMKKGDFSVKGKSQGQLQSEFKRVRQFLQSPTSTVSGWKKVRKETAKRIGGGFASEDSEKAYWRAYRKIAESERALHMSYGSTETQRYLHQELNDSAKLTEEEILAYQDLYPDDSRDLAKLSQLDRAVVRTLIEMGEDYETQQQEEQGRYGGNGGFFRVGGDL